MTGRFEINLSEADLISAFRLNARFERVRPVILAAVVVALLLVALLLLSSEARHSATSRPISLLLEGALAIVALLLALLFAALKPLWRRAARRSLVERRDLAETIRYEFSPEALRHVTCFSDSTYPWSAIHCWRENDELLLIYISFQLFYPIPKRQVEPVTMAALLEILGSSGVRKC